MSGMALGKTNNTTYTERSAVNCVQPIKFRLAGHRFPAILVSREIITE